METTKFLEDLEKENLLYLYLGSLVTVENNITVDECEENLKKINFCLSILPENNIKDKEKIKQILIDCKKVISTDLSLHWKNYNKKK